MALIVQKHGGAAMADLDHLRELARRALRTQRAGNQVVVVVSALAGEVSRMHGLASALGPRPEAREQDVLAAAAGQAAAGLAALAVRAEGGHARSFTGRQAGIRTDSTHAGARIRSVDGRGLRQALDRGEVAVVAGIQGEDEGGEVTTLGPGGSDVAAVAVAAALGAGACEIHGRADGVHSADPALCPSARRLRRVTHEELLELAGAGAGAPPIRAVELAMKQRVALWIGSSAGDEPGTLCGPEEEAMERPAVTAIASDRNTAKVALCGVSDRPGVAARVFAPLAEAGIVVDLIVQNASREGRTDVTFTVAKTDLARAKDVVESTLKAIGAEKIETDGGIGKVSIVGAGMKHHAGVAARAFEVMARAGINIELISTSEIKIAMVVQERHLERAVRELHAAFGLDAPPAR
ncbi:MAG TPA: aspartate kinase [Anaeromyxobacteraceae bacterium]|nr:aspartate kinase [Anaeromyxobacteraceae bacterium]